MTNSKLLCGTFFVCGTLLMVGCSDSGNSQQTDNQPSASETGSSSEQQGEYLLSSEPEGAQGVAEARKKIPEDQNEKKSEEVALVGRVGGSAEPFVEGIAAFQIVDPQLTPCEDKCPTPWDYCCDLDTLPENRATVKVVDSQGNPVMTDARELLGIKELNTVVVRGQAQRDDAGNLTVLADGVFVKQ